MFPYVSTETNKELNLVTKGIDACVNKLYFNKDEKVYFLVTHHGFLRVFKKVNYENHISVIEKELSKDGEYVLVSKKNYSLEEIGSIFNGAVVI